MAKYDAAIVGKVLKAVGEGKTTYSVSKQYGVPRTTIDRWVQNAGMGAVAHKTREELEDRGARLINDYLESIHFTLAASRDPEWVKRQEADKLAVFLGTISDKVFIVLAASERAQYLRQLAERGESDTATSDGSSDLV